MSFLFFFRSNTHFHPPYKYAKIRHMIPLVVTTLSNTTDEVLENTIENGWRILYNYVRSDLDYFLQNLAEISERQIFK